MTLFLVVLLALIRADCPPGYAAFCVPVTSTPSVLPSGTATETPTAPPTSTPVASETPSVMPEPSQTPIVDPGATSNEYDDCQQLGCSPGANGYRDQPPLRGLRLAWRWSPRADYEPVLCQGVRHHTGKLVTICVYCSGYGCEEHPGAPPHSGPYRVAILDPTTGRPISEAGGILLGHTATGRWPAFLTRRWKFRLNARFTLDRGWTGARIIEGITCGLGSEYDPHRWSISCLRGDSERWADVTSSSRLGVFCSAECCPWVGGRVGFVGCKAADGSWSVAHHTLRGHVQSQPNDNAWPAQVVLDETTSRVVYNLHFEARPFEQTGLYVHDIRDRDPVCFVPGFFGHPAARDGTLYAVRDSIPLNETSRFRHELARGQTLVELNLRTCATREFPIPPTTWDQPPTVTSDRVYYLDDLGDVVAWDRASPRLLWQRPVGARKSERRAYVDEANDIRILADRGQLYIAGDRALVVLSHDGAELGRVSIPSDSVGYLAWNGRGLVAVDRYDRMQCGADVECSELERRRQSYVALGFAESE